ncbi:hypothetical protein [Micromonospora sp. NPDC005299]|uniref:hypothetical protein n=1 Tax=Micromonospora sp. NPDC005299 TaxID=3364231 RepID=UPI003673A4D3
MTLTLALFFIGDRHAVFRLVRRLAQAAVLYLLHGMLGASGAIAIVGVLFVGSVTLVGYLLREQSDRRLRDENERAEHRLCKEHEEETRRLKLDAAAAERAGALFGPADSVDVHLASAASGLLALTKLDQADLAVVLLVDLWSGDKGAISTEAAVLVIDAALQRRNDPKAQLIAAELLCRNATRLDSCTPLHWPSAADRCWDPVFGPSRPPTHRLLAGRMRSSAGAPP